MLTCQLCQATHPTMISNSHLRKHGHAGASYKELFPSAVLRVQSVESRTKMAATKKGTAPWNKGNKAAQKKIKKEPILNRPRKRQASFGRKLGPNKKISGARTGDKNWMRRAFNEKIEKLCVAENLRLLGRKSSAPTCSALSFECNICGHEFSFTCGYFTKSQQQLGHAVKTGICPACHPRSKLKSKKELEVLEFVRSIINEPVISGSRAVIFPFELDIWIPSMSTAIEFNGTYWHSEKVLLACGAHPQRDHQKYVRCREHSIRLISINEKEWDYQQEVVKSRLRHLIGVNKGPVIHARKCELVELSPEVAHAFILENGLEMAEGRSLGAIYNDQLVAVAIFNQSELISFMIKKNMRVPGIMSRLLKLAECTSTCSDNRWVDGGSLKIVGFDLTINNGPKIEGGSWNCGTTSWIKRS